MRSFFLFSGKGNNFYPLEKKKKKKPIEIAKDCVLLFSSLKLLVKQMLVGDLTTVQ